jgi:hypothetical protein
VCELRNTDPSSRACGTFDLFLSEVSEEVILREDLEIPTINDLNYNHTV